MGIPLLTRAQRRRVVVGYYLLIALTTLPALILDKPVTIMLAIQALTIGALFGDVKPGESAKAPSTSSTDGQEAETLSRTGDGPWTSFTPGHERESKERHVAHYRAYVILRWSLLAVVVAYFALSDFIPHWLASNSLTLVWLLAVLIISLPQAVILWTKASSLTEPEFTQAR